MKGKVYIIGAGCGNIELLSLKGKKIIESADCVIYDRLIDKKILKLARKDAELIYLGKLNTEGGLIQEEINQTIVKKALEGKSVARVKGGDPFVFGRGGEEIEEVVKNGIQFEIVPGISSSIAVPEYAGIPVTHRGVSKSFHVFTGHTAENEKWHDFQSIAKLEGTLIFLMGIKNIGRISKDLLQHGKLSTTPVAIIEKGTTPFQRVITGTLEDIEKKAEKENVVPPAIIVVGDVVKFRDEFMWREKQSLFGKRILITRDEDSAGEMGEKFVMEGAYVSELPLIKIQRREEYAEFPNLKEYSCVLFNSPNGVRSFMEMLSDIREIGHLKIGAVGKKTGEILREYRIKPDFMPEEYRIDKLAEVSVDYTEKNDKILVITSDISPCNSQEWKAAYEREYEKFVAYSTKKTPGKLEEVKEILKEIDYIVLMSSSTAESLYESLDGEVNLLQGKTLVSIGPVTSDTIRKLGMKVGLEATEYDVDGIFKAIEGDVKNVQ